MEVVNASQSMLTNSEMLEVLRENKKLGKEVGYPADPSPVLSEHLSLPLSLPPSLPPSLPLSLSLSPRTSSTAARTFLRGKCERQDSDRKSVEEWGEGRGGEGLTRIQRQ